jgi:putative SOS response-associated peptidase YedK
MCGRLSPYRGIHDFVAALSIPNTLINYAGDQSFEFYNAAPPAQLALFHLEGQFLQADRVRWLAHNPFFRAIWPHRAVIAIDNWFEWVDEGGPRKQPYLIRRKGRAPILCTAIGQYPHAEHEPDAHDGFVFISVDSKGGIVAIHDWQPVTLSPELAREWLNPATPKERAEQIMLLHWEPTEAFEWFKVDRPVGNIRNQQSSLINPISTHLSDLPTDSIKLVDSFDE